MSGIRGHDGLSLFPHVEERNCPTMPNLDGQDYVILNSTTNVPKALDVLHGYGRIHCLLDNDEAGRKHTKSWQSNLTDASGTSPTTITGIKT